MHDFAAICIINAAVIASSVYFNKNLNYLRAELVSGIGRFKLGQFSVRGEIIGKLDSIYTDLHILIAEHRRHSQRLTNLEKPRTSL